MNDVGTGDSSVLVLSQDYELFFGVSGTIEKCLLDPCDALLAYAQERDLRVTFFVDAGMLLAMRRYGTKSREVAKMDAAVSRHIESLAKAGHEIGLHVHPHWEDTRWGHRGWEFAETRYALRDFSDGEVQEIMTGYTSALAELANASVTSYRAGGFCIEPFDKIRRILRQLGIFADSSVVPGARLEDVDKGFDFSAAPDLGWWRFGTSPVKPDSEGEFVEIGITPMGLPVSHYWGRLIDRLKPGPSATSMGDGISKAIGKTEILRRLLGAGRISELSLDAAKAHHLSSRHIVSQRRPLWQIMGHPKLLGHTSFDHLDDFFRLTGVERVVSVSEAAQLAREGSLPISD